MTPVDVLETASAVVVSLTVTGGAAWRWLIRPNLSEWLRVQRAATAQATTVAGAAERAAVTAEQSLGIAQQNQAILQGLQWSGLQLDNLDHRVADLRQGLDELRTALSDHAAQLNAHTKEHTP